MNFFGRLIANYPFTNVLFFIVLVSGIYSYSSLPRQQDPDINFNWVEISVVLPGATTNDIEEQVTNVIEDALSNIQDVRFIMSVASTGVSSTLVRFKQLDDLQFNKRLSDLRREVQNAETDLPEEAISPMINEITTSTGFPTATILIAKPALDEDLYYHANLIVTEMKRIRGMEKVLTLGYSDPEIHIKLNRAALENYRISPGEVSNTLRQALKDISVGSMDIDQEEWSFSLDNSLSDTDKIADIPILGRPDVYIGNLADVSTAREEPGTLVTANGNPAIQINLFKSPNTNVLDLTDDIVDYVDKKNISLAVEDIRISMLDDQSPTTRKALEIMETNSIIGLMLVLFSTWFFLGTGVATFCTLGIPFVLCLVFIIIKALGQTLNISVLLALVMSVGIVVDNMIVVAESIRFKMRQGLEATQAAFEGLAEVIKPLTSGILTTIAAFAPLMFVEGILGQFLLVIPLVVTVALLMSMVESYWILPSQVMMVSDGNSKKPSRLEHYRKKIIDSIQRNYLKILIKVIREPKKTFIYVMAGLSLAIVLFSGGIFFPQVHQSFLGRLFLKIEFFAFDPLRILYFNTTTADATALDSTLRVTERLEQKIRAMVEADEIRGVSSYAGLQFNDQGVESGSDRGQVLVSLLPSQPDSEPIDQIRDRILADVRPEDIGAASISSTILEGGPPKTKPIQLNVLGDDFNDIRNALQDIVAILEDMQGVFDIEVKEDFGQKQVILSYNHDAINSDGIQYAEIDDLLATLTNGLIIGETRRWGETTEIRVKVDDEQFRTTADVLNYRIKIRDGASVPLSRYVQFETRQGLEKIQHFDFRRNIRIEADLSGDSIYNQQSAASHLLEVWDDKYAQKHPAVSLNTSGILDDLNEAIASMFRLFLLGVLVIYLILCNEFRSYYKPFLILTPIPLAFVGVVFGLLLSNHPLSLFTMYGLVGLTGIAVNASIVLIDAVERRREAGMPLIHAVVYASRRRVIPIIITSLTTMAGLFSLATGIGGSSLVWGPVAIVIVWGVGISSAMTLIIVPYLYLLFHRNKKTAKPIPADISSSA